MATRETRAVRVREWRRSGLTAAAFAEREGINAGTLTWWSSKLGRSAVVRARPPVLEVKVAARESPSSLEVVLGSGVRVAVPVDFDEATLGRLLSVLGER